MKKYFIPLLLFSLILSSCDICRLPPEDLKVCILSSCQIINEIDTLNCEVLSPNNYTTIYHFGNGKSETWNENANEIIRKTFINNQLQTTIRYFFINGNNCHSIKYYNAQDSLLQTINLTFRDDYLREIETDSSIIYVNYANAKRVLDVEKRKNTNEIIKEISYEYLDKVSAPAGSFLFQANFDLVQKMEIFGENSTMLPSRVSIKQNNQTIVKTFRNIQIDQNGIKLIMSEMNPTTTINTSYFYFYSCN